MLQRLEELLELSPQVGGRRFLVSWSGGPDSTALLHLLVRLRDKFSFRLCALHINFGLRGEDSDGDEEFCRRWANEHQVNLILHRAPDDYFKSTGIQEAARALRIEVSTRLLPDWELLEAHQADDQLETFLFRLFRGTGLDGLAGMPIKQFREQRRLWRPLLAFKKSEILEYLKEEGVSYCTDKSNLGTDYDRNFIRNEILPLVLSRFPHVFQSVSRLQEQILEEKSFFESKIWEEVFPQLIHQNEPLQLHRPALIALPKALRLRLIHGLFWREVRASLSRQQTLELDEKLLSGLSFAFNAPRGAVVRCGLGQNPRADLVEFDFSSVLR